MVTGEEIRGEVSSADATTAVTVLWYKPNGAAYLPASPERIVITDVIWAAVSGAGTVKIFSDNNADGSVNAGEMLLPLALNGSLTLVTEIFAGQGKTVKAKAGGAGQIDIVLVGKIIRT